MYSFFEGFLVLMKSISRKVIYGGIARILAQLWNTICFNCLLFQSGKLKTLPRFFLNRCCNHSHCEISSHKCLFWNQM